MHDSYMKTSIPLGCCINFSDFVSRISQQVWVELCPLASEKSFELSVIISVSFRTTLLWRKKTNISECWFKELFVSGWPAEPAAKVWVGFHWKQSLVLTMGQHTAQEHTAHRLLPSPPQNSHTVKLTRGAQGVLPQAAWGAGDQWMPIHSEILPHCRHVPRADPTDFPHSFRPRAQALPFLRDRTSFYFHSFSSSLHSFSLLLSWFPFLSSKLGLRWAQMVVQGPCTTTKTKAVLKYVDQMEQLETIEKLEK